MAARRPSPSATAVAGVRPWLGAAVAIGIGTWGVRALVAGRGQVTIFPPVGAEGLRWVALVTVGWAVAATAARERPSISWALRGIALAVGTAATAPNIGRATGATAIASVIVAHAATVGWQPRSGWPARPRQVAWAGIATVAVAQVVWTTQAEPWPTIVVLGLALVVVDLHHRRPAGFERVYLWTARTGAAAVGAGRVVGRRLANRSRGIGAAVVDRVRQEPLPVMVGLLGALVMLPIAYRYSSTPPSVLPASDYHVHLQKAAETQWLPFRPAVPYPLYHLPVAALIPVVGLAWASTLVIAAAGSMTALVLHDVGRRPFAGRAGLGAGMAGAFAIGYFIADSPALVAQALRVGNPRDWAPTIHVYLSPTDTLLAPFAFLLVAMVARSVDGERTRRRGSRLAAVAVATALAKPSLSLAFLPAVPIYLLVARRTGRDVAIFFGRWLYLPTAAIIAVQTWFLQSGVNEFDASGFAVEPLATLRMLNLDKGGALLFAATLVVPIAWWAAGRRYAAEPAIGLSLGSFAVALLLLLLLRETGVRGEEPVFSKPATIVAGVLIVFSWRSLLGDGIVAWRERAERRPPLWFWVGSAFLVLTLAGGLLGYLESAGVLSLPVRPTG